MKKTYGKTLSNYVYTLETCMVIVEDKRLKIHWIITNLTSQQLPHMSAN